MLLFKKRIIAVLALTLLIVSFGVVGVSAKAKVPRPQSISQIAAHPGYKSIMLIWRSSPQKILGYRVYYSSDGKNYKLIRQMKPTNTQFVACNVPNLAEKKNHRFRVTAYVNDEYGKALESYGVYTVATPVREMRYILHLKSGRNVYASKFSGGQYVVDRGRGYDYYPKSRVSYAEAEYTTSMNYSRISAENYVNAMKFSSSTRSFIWCNTYTQHIYLFTGSRGNWKCIDDWECATGKASSPTPTGTNGRKEIWAKDSYRNAVPWWSAFSSWNAFHGKRGSWTFGRPASGGCVRNPNEKAKKIYQSTAMGTSVLIY